MSDDTKKLSRSEPRPQANLMEVMARIGQALRDEGFELNAERFEQQLKRDRQDEDA